MYLIREDENKPYDSQNAEAYIVRCKTEYPQLVIVRKDSVGKVEIGRLQKSEVVPDGYILA